jgi:hypothetical protein
LLCGEKYPSRKQPRVAREREREQFKIGKGAETIFMPGGSVEDVVSH